MAKLYEAPPQPSAFFESLYQPEDFEFLKYPEIAALHALATEAHAGQRRYTGEEYIWHPRSVAADLYQAGLMQEDLPWEKVCTGLGHDLFEDTKARPRHLRDIGVSERVVRAITTLSNTCPRGPMSKNEHYIRVFIPSLIDCEDPEVVQDVKYVDLTKNLIEFPVPEWVLRAKPEKRQKIEYQKEALLMIEKAMLKRDPNHPLVWRRHRLMAVTAELASLALY